VSKTDRQTPPPIWRPTSDASSQCIRHIGRAWLRLRILPGETATMTTRRNCAAENSDERSLRTRFFAAMEGSQLWRIHATITRAESGVKNWEQPSPDTGNQLRNFRSVHDQVSRNGLGPMGCCLMADFSDCKLRRIFRRIVRRMGSDRSDHSFLLH
jgi:hypothetical protein